MSSLIDDLMAGRALLSDFDDRVEEWHTASGAIAEDHSELHEYLGLSWDEYRLCVENPHALRFVVVAHKMSRPVEEILAETRDVALAARSEDRADAEDLHRWLVSTGRIKATSE